MTAATRAEPAPLTLEEIDHLLAASALELNNPAAERLMVIGSLDHYLDMRLDLMAEQEHDR